MAMRIGCIGAPKTNLNRVGQVVEKKIAAKAKNFQQNRNQYKPLGRTKIR